MQLLKKFLLLPLLLTTWGIMAQEVSVNYRNTALRNVLNDIAKQTGKELAYSESSINLNQRVSIVASNRELESVLDELAGTGGISYSLKENKILLHNKNTSLESQDGVVITVKGTVKDNNGDPMIGVNIVGKNNTGAISDIDGKYSIETPSNGTLTFSYIGYITQTIEVKGNSSINVVMQEDAKQMDEIVVIGYGAVRKSDLTGAIASVKMDEINSSAPSLEKALIGHTPGVEIKQTSGAPGAGTSIRIRGVNSVYSSVEPLFVIDGYPASKDLYINPSDVASIEVLKDAASAAIYGSRASGGVVLITTKRGKAGKPKVELSYQFSGQQLAKKIDMMNAYQLRELHKDGYNNAYFDYLRVNNLYGSDDDRWYHSRNDDAETRKLMGATEGKGMILCPDYLNTDYDTDWQDELYSTAPMHRANFNVSGGKENYKYMFSLGYLNQEGIIAPSNHNRITTRFNMDMDISERFNVNVSSNMYYVKERPVRSDGMAGSDAVVLSALGMPPMYPMYNDDGSYAIGWSYRNALPYVAFGGEHPVALAHEVQQHYTRFRFAGNVDLNYKILKQLYAKLSGGMQVSDQIYRYYRPAGTIGQGANPPGDFVNLAKASNDRDFNIDYLIEATLNYNQSFGKHSLNAVAGYSMQEKIYDNIDVRGLGFTNDRIPEISGAGPVPDNKDGTTAVTDRSAWSLMSMFGRVIYGYDGRYNLSASLRGDGCSRFGSDNRWGIFPSVSGGWNISNESFWEDITFMTAKLRASWGISGNNNIGNYRHIPLINSGTYNIGSETVTWYAPSGFTDMNLGWEKTSQTNIGLDLGFLNNRINLIANYYYSVTNDLLYQNTVSAITGSTRFWTNLTEGKVYNRGFDLQLDVAAIATPDFKWNIGGNISLNRNKVEGLEDEIIEKAQRSQITHITKNGQPIGSYYGMVSQGIITKEDYENIVADKQHVGEEGYVLQGPPVADYSQVYIGDVKWKDVNGDNKITEDDREIIGNNYPDISYGFSTSFTYKNITLSATFDGQLGNDVINFSRYYICNMEGGVNTMTYGLDRYRDEENPGNGMVYRANRTAKNLNTKFSTYFVEDGSFFRCTNITLGYTIPENNFFKRIKMDRMYIYGSVDNLFMITKYLGYNPDVSYNSGNLCPGIDFGTYPLARTWSVGINLSF